MRTSDERVQDIKNKVKSKRDRRLIVWTAGSVACVLLVLTVVCSLPILGEGAPNVNAYKNDAYYPLIEKINSCYQDDRYSVFDSIGNLFNKGFGAMAPGGDMDMSFPSANPDTPTDEGEGMVTDNKYVETTLNQVDGVIEGDILKRSATHAFYLRNGYFVGDERCLALDVYALKKSATDKVCQYVIRAEDDTSFGSYRATVEGEMFLNSDVTRATVIVPCTSKEGVIYTTVISLDISNPAEISEVDRVYVSGKFLSARKVEGKLLVITNFSVGYSGNYGYNFADYGNKDTYVPRCGDMSDDALVPMDDIYVPEVCPELNYTVLALLNEQTLEVVDKQAVFSYALDAYVSKNYIVVARNVRYFYEAQFDYGKEISQDKAEKLPASKMIALCEIVAFKYADGFKFVGKTGVEGFVKDRYSMDEQDGVLRMFTTIRHKNAPFVWELQDSLNVSLYCLNLSDMKVLASKERFAPAGDEVKSARFEGNKAYVCTARGIIDPVFYFDLSDLNNIIYKDTGEIAGFSDNLIKFNEYLLGIGQGEKAETLKVELYKESDDASAQNGVVSVDDYKLPCSYSREYKAHFVNAEHSLVGLQVRCFNNDDLVTDKPASTVRAKYLLLRFDEQAQTLETVYFKAFDCEEDYARSFYEHDGVYVFGPNGYLFVDLAK